MRYLTSHVFNWGSRTNASRIAKAATYALESLEERRLLAFEAHVNFQPALLQEYPGYVSDVGDVYGAQSGYTFGWDQLNLGHVERDSSLSPDQRYDTLAFLQRRGIEYVWEIEVPDGNYLVHAVGGDPLATSGTMKTNVEGVLTIDGQLSSTVHWIEGTQTVSVTDGRLTVASASGAVSNRINFIDIAQVPDTPQELTVENNGRTHRLSLKWKEVSDATSYDVETPNDLGVWSVVANVTDTSYVATSLSEGTGYAYRIVAKNDVGASLPSASAEAFTANFRILDDTNKWHNLPNPDPRIAAGLEQVHRSGVSQWQHFVSGDELDEEATIQIAREAAGLQGSHMGEPRGLNINFETVVEDIDYTLGQARVDQTIRNFLMLIDTVRQVWDDTGDPEIQNLHIAGYNTPFGMDASYEHKVLANNYFFNTPMEVDTNPKPRALSEVLTYMMPDLYTATTDVGAWARGVPAWLEFAATFGRPVFGYVWPMYHEPTATVDPIHTELPGADWQTELDVVRQNADGAVIWSGERRWNPDAEWWDVTDGYLAQPLGLSPAMPENLSIDASGTKLNWDPVADASVIYVERRTGLQPPIAPFERVGGVRGDLTTWTETAPVVGTNVWYRIWAENAFGASDKIEVNLDGTVVRNAMVRNEAENFEAIHGFALGHYNASVGNMNAYGWVRYDLDFTADATQFSAALGRPHDTSTHYIRVLVDPLVVGTQILQAPIDYLLPVQTTAEGYNEGWGTMIEQSWNLGGAIGEGSHVIYVTVPNTEGSGAANFDWFRFGDVSAAPAPPRELTVNSMGSSVQLRWHDWAHGETDYEIDRQMSDGTWETISSLTTSSVTPSITLEPEEFGFSRYQVRAVKTVDEVTQSSARSNRDGGTTDARSGQIQAELYDEPSALEFGGNSPNGSPSGTGINVWQQTADRTTTRYRGVQFGDGSEHFVMRLGTYVGYVGNEFEVWIDGDGLDRWGRPWEDGGKKVGTLTTLFSGDWDIFLVQSTRLQMPGGGPITGVHDLHIKAIDPQHDQHDGLSIARVDWFSVDPDAASVVGSAGNDEIWLKRVNNHFNAYINTNPQSSQPKYSIAVDDPHGLVLAANIGVDNIFADDSGGSFGTVKLNGGGVTGNLLDGDVTIGQGALVTFNSDHKLSHLLIEDNAQLSVSPVIPSPNNRLLRVNDVAIAPTGILDLADNDMIVSTLHGPTAADQVRDYLAAFIHSARNGGAWDGFGIRSSEATANTMLGVIAAHDYQDIWGVNHPFAGTTVNDGDVLVKFTYYGDTDFNGVVDMDDYVRIDTGNGQGWLYGDFDLNGVFDGADWALIDYAYLTQGDPL